MSARTSRSFVLLLLLFTAPAPGQAPPELVPCGAPLAPLPPCGEPPKPALPPLAVVDGTVITIKDLDEKLMRSVERLDEAIREARRNALESEIDSVLLECEAARLKMTPRDLYEAEITRKVAAPSDGEMKAEFEGHRDRYSRPFEEESVRVASRLAHEKETARVAELTRSLRSRFPVTINEIHGGKTTEGGSLPPSTILATVGPRSITQASAATRLDAAAFAVARAVWEEESKAIKRLVRDRLMKNEAATRGMPADAILRTEVDERMTAPTDAEITAYTQKFRSFYGDDPAAARPKVIEALRRDQRATLEKELDRKLAIGRQVRIAAQAPRRPTLTIDTGRSPSRGNPHAAVTLVEMGDFQCPPCGRIWGLLDEALKPYEGRVRSVFRQVPLGMHEFAFKAAEASLAAHEQGKFWLYADILYHHQNALDVASLKRYAAEAGLDGERFARDLDSGRLAAEVREEKRASARCGVVGTPKLFVNGVPLLPSDYSVEGIRAALDDALRAATHART